MFIEELAEHQVNRPEETPEPVALAPELAMAGLNIAESQEAKRLVMQTTEEIQDIDEIPTPRKPRPDLDLPW